MQKKKNSQKTFLEYGFLKILAVTVKPLSLTKHAHVNCWEKKKKITPHSYKGFPKPRNHPASLPATTNQVFVSHTVLAC